jgi:hypothetical protein
MDLLPGTLDLLIPRTLQTHPGEGGLGVGVD